jgi:hypothetical protein
MVVTKHLTESESGGFDLTIKAELKSFLITRRACTAEFSYMSAT